MAGVAGRPLRLCPGSDTNTVHGGLRRRQSARHRKIGGTVLRGLAVLIRILRQTQSCPSCARPIPKDVVKCPYCATWLPSR